MKTELLVVAHGVDPAAVQRAVPPACRSTARVAEAAAVRAGEWLIETGPWAPRQPARHFVPAFSLLAPEAAAFRFELSVRTGGAWSPWVASATIGSERFAPPLPGAAALACDVDVFTSPAPAEVVALRVRARAPAVAAPWLVTLSASDLAPLVHVTAPLAVARIPVTPRSQMAEPDELRRRICSPTSVAMVLEHWGQRVDTAAVTADAFDAATDRYGVWPAAVAAAAKRGVPGYLLRFPDWAAAAWCLAAGLPIVASVRYGRGELPGAAMDETDGHLVVITGAEGDDVLLNDPAADTVAGVPRRVPRAAFERAWLEGTGVGYVFFSAGDRATSTRSTGSARRRRRTPRRAG